MNSLSKYRPLTQELFDNDIINESKPAILVFAAEWSGTAEMMHSIVERIANSKEQNQSLNYYSIDVEKMPNIASFFGISIVPTVIFIQHGEVINKVQGLVSSSKFKKLINLAFSDPIA